MNSFLRVACLVAAMLCLAARSHAQFVDPEVDARGWRLSQSLKELASPLLPTGAEMHILARDGLVFNWSIRLPDDCDIDALARETRAESTDPRTVLDEWSTRLAAKLCKLTTTLVREDATDPGFNPQTDVELSVYMRRVPPRAGDEAIAGESAEHYSVAFVGDRRSALRDGNRNVIRPPSRPADGGEIIVVIAPERTQWDLRESITGNITIRNTGTSRIHLDSWHIGRVIPKGADGREPPDIPLRVHGNIAPNAAMLEFLNPGDEHTKKFTLYTDPLRSAFSGFELAAGEWLLGYADQDDSNIRVICTPARIEVAAETKYHGPRILYAQGAGSNIVLQREEAVIDVLDGATGARLGIKQIGRGIRMWPRFAHSSDGRLVAYTRDRKQTIGIEEIFGPPPAFPVITLATAAEKGFFVERFLAGDRSLSCIVDQARTSVSCDSGEATPGMPMPEPLTRVSPDGLFAVARRGLAMHLVGSRGSDEFTIGVFNLRDRSKDRDVTIRKRGDFADFTMGAHGVYLCNEFEPDVVFVPYEAGEMRIIKVDAPAQIVGESEDGAHVAFIWPQKNTAQETGAMPMTGMGVYRTRDGGRLSKITWGTPHQAIMLSSPARIVCWEQHGVGAGLASQPWLDESATVHDINTGLIVKKLDLTPPVGFAPDK